MMIQEEQAILDEQLESLYEATNVSQGNRDAWRQLWIAIGAIVIDVIVNIDCSRPWVEWDAAMAV